MRVWSYWKCDYCSSIIRGDLRNCPNCGGAISNDAEYLMPDNPEVIEAINNGTILTSGKIHTDEKGIKSEIIDEKDYKTGPNWKCLSCGSQNWNNLDRCESCGAPRSNIDHFSNEKSEETKISENLIAKSSYPRTNDEKIKPSLTYPKASNRDYIKESIEKNTSKLSMSDILSGIWMWITNHVKPIVITFIFLTLVAFFTWLFWPVTREASVRSFRWQYDISVEEFRECHESDWSLPSGAQLEYTRNEIHHYDHVLDHYETKTRQCSRQVQDGYDTSYRNLGNGQVEVVQTPRYRTEYYTETYQEPVYVDVPVYRTKYYYEIGRWKYDYSLTTSGNDKNTYWHETDLPTTVNNPVYGDDKQGPRYEHYYVTILNENEEYSEITVNGSTWYSLEPYQKITYKSFRFSHNPITNIENVVSNG